MSKIKKIEPIVKKVLEDNENARNDDFELVLMVYGEINENAMFRPFYKVMREHKAYGLPSMESITRCRRRLQTKYEHLKANKETEKIREKEEEEFREYAKEK